jgi:putative spermidine/putrescine transport system ATP-binding protein
LRPEKVRLFPDEDAFVNRIKAKVAELIYYGDHTRLSASVCGRDDFIIKVPSTGELPLQPGSDVVVGWRREDCRALAIE